MLKYKTIISEISEDFDVKVNKFCSNNNIITIKFVASPVNRVGYYIAFIQYEDNSTYNNKVEEELDRLAQEY